MAPAQDPSEPRERAAVALLDASEGALRRTARRYSLCAADADDAFQRALEILLTKAPQIELRRLAAWTQVVIRREALALRRERERLLGLAPPEGPEGRPTEAADGLELLPSDRPGPAERAERRERVLEGARALATLKPHQRRAIVLQAQGYSYAEICAMCGWSYTKLNRCLVEGRARLREKRA